MAYQFTAGTVPANLIEAINETHRSTVGLESAVSHYDGPEVDPSGVKQVLTTFFPSAIATLADAINCVEKGIVLFDSHHALRSNGGNGKRVFAHKTNDTVIGGTPSAVGAQLESDIVTSWGPLAIAQLTALKGHMTNVGGTWHGSPDLFNVVSIPSAITTKRQLFEAILMIRAVDMDHIASSSGGAPHSSADSTNTITAAPPDTEDDWDGMKGVLTEVATKLPAHAADSGIHANAQTISGLTAPAWPASVTSAFARANTLKAKHEAHRQSTSFHQAADSSTAISAADATTMASFLTLSEELRTDQSAHFDVAPITRAVRSL